MEKKFESEARNRIAGIFFRVKLEERIFAESNNKFSATSSIHIIALPIEMELN